VIALSGVVVGVIAGAALARVAASYVEGIRLPDALPTLVAAALLVGAAILASLTPAIRAARVDVVRALRAD
jgi:ABC-type antimicrobial peptide transport system permease subunit